jgi:hypothetical protein
MTIQNNYRILFALDYDDTYTRDPDMWLMFIELLRSRGHDVIIATMRDPSEASDMDPRLLAIVEVQFTSGQQKKPVLDKRGIYPSIWIDDRPDWIVYN